MHVIRPKNISKNMRKGIHKIIIRPIYAKREKWTKKVALEVLRRFWEEYIMEKK